MDIPFYEQETDWTCGPASVRMVFDALGIRKSEKQVMNLLGTTKQGGTWHKYFPRLAEKYKLNYIVKRNSSISNLKEYLRRGYLLIVCYYPPEENVSHYSVVKKIYSGVIYFLDPEDGPEHKYKIKYFMQLWNRESRYDKERRWFIGMKKPKNK